MIQFTCGKCGQLMEAPDTQMGTYGKCPACKRLARVPGGRRTPVFRWVGGALLVIVAMRLIWVSGVDGNEPAPAREMVRRTAPPRPGSWRDKVGGVFWHWTDEFGYVTWPLDKRGEGKADLKGYLSKRGGKWGVGPYSVTLIDQAGRAYHMAGEWLPVEVDDAGKPESIGLRYRHVLGKDASLDRIGWYVGRPMPAVKPSPNGWVLPGEIPPPQDATGRPYRITKPNRPDSVRVFIGGDLAAIWLSPWPISRDSQF